MTAPYAGGFEITDIWLEGVFALKIAFTTTYATSYQYQIYINRTLSGVTESTSDRELFCNWQPSAWPQEIQLLAVDPAEQATDYGADLPPRPYNQVKLTIVTSGWDDAKYIEITSGLTPGAAVDLDNVIRQDLFDTNGTYIIITDPLEGTGEWNFAAAGRDDTLPNGNRGTATAVSRSIYSRPPDFEPQTDGTRFSLSASGGNLLSGFTEAI